MFLFGKSHKSPAEIVGHLKSALLLLDKNSGKKGEKTLETITRWLQAYESTLFGHGGHSPDPVQVAALVQETHYTNLLLFLVKNLPKLDFETKKQVTTVFSNLLRRQVGNRCPTVEYLCARYDVLLTLVNGYQIPEIALTCGNILRESFRYEDLAKVILYSPILYNFFPYIEASSFDLASDAFATFKDLLTKHKSITAKFFETNYEQFFTNYQKLLISENYVTRRQSLKLLGELLLGRQNFDVMTRYISDTGNLKLIMNLLREKSRTIQFEAFHVFKIFVANPNKTKSVTKILARNKEKLIVFLNNFQPERTNDEQFLDEKTYLSPLSVVQHLKEALRALEKKGAKKERVLEEVGRWLQVYEDIFTSHSEDPAQIGSLAQATYYFNILVMLVKNLCDLNFETRKRVVSVFSQLLRRKIGARFPTVEYLCARYDLLFTLLKGVFCKFYQINLPFSQNQCVAKLSSTVYESPEVALNCGMILRDCARHEDLVKIILDSPQFYDLFDYTEGSCFDISSDAFTTIKDLLTRHQQICATFLVKNYKSFFSNYQRLLCSKNYVTRRQSLKLLGELLLDRYNYEIMIRYINDAENLKLIMNLLRERSRGVQFEAFHVFKIFVANPNKTRRVADILQRNREKLLHFLADFQKDRLEDQQFVEEKAYMIKQIEEMGFTYNSS
ncbi:unnamed protein product [Enterobius vermicularis]|uniref:Non-specific serine/threonine protein kinase n=1 Tax=Enterobius vermicularis TaxID=51028 RepID=A0A0N4V0Q7_ENTVE|nr:unnamed protein product [Enterobius vermicularis]